MTELKKDCIMYGTGDNPGDRGLDTECRGLKELECARRTLAFDDDTIDYNQSHLKSVIEEEIQPLIEQEVGSENLVEHIVDLARDKQSSFFCDGLAG